MKKNSITRILLTVALLATIGMNDAMAGGRYPCPTFNLKRHQFGFGVSSALCDGMSDVNQYLVDGWQLVASDGGINIRTYHTAYYGLYFDYQYRFNDSWSLEARLKYKHRNTEMDMTVQGTMTIGSINFSYADFALPVTCNFRWVTRSGSSIELFAGLGLTTLGFGGNYETLMSIDNGVEVANTYLSLCYDRAIDGFAIAGIQFEIPYELFTLKPFVSYSFSPFRNAEYTIEPQNTNSILSQTVSSWPLHVSDLEVGISMQF